jgi:uncharacterized protein YciI/uncharacterized protein YndB with AHSA1/START domain
MSIEILPVKKQFTVKTGQERAFRLFTDGMDRWWPREHHIGTSPMKKILVEPRVGGRWYSISEDGTECDIGKVLTWAPPSRLVLAWQITAKWAFDPAFTTEVEVRFAADGPKTTVVDFEHRNLERYGSAAEGLRKQLDDPKGWNGSFERFARVAAMKAVVLYEAAPDVMTTAPLHFPAHKERLDAFQAKGELLGVGTFADPRDGSMAIFRTREGAEDFVAGDPFVRNGVVSKATIKDWSEALLG